MSGFIRCPSSRSSAIIVFGIDEVMKKIMLKLVKNTSLRGTGDAKSMYDVNTQLRAASARLLNREL